MGCIETNFERCEGEGRNNPNERKKPVVKGVRVVKVED